MIPIRDTIPTKTYPIVNNALIATNVVFFLVELSQGPGLERFIYMYGLVPARYTIPQIASYFTTGQQLVSLITFMFLHGGFWHLLGNMAEPLGRSSDYKFLMPSFVFVLLPRKARIDAPGVLHHIIVSGIERRKIFYNDRRAGKKLNSAKNY